MHPFLLLPQDTSASSPARLPGSWVDLVEINPSLSWMANAQGGLHCANSPWIALTGIDPAVREISTLADLVHPDDVSRLSQSRQPDDSGRTTHEYRLRQANREYCWVRENIAELRSEEGTFAGYLGCAISIQTEKTNEQRSHQTQKMEALGLLASGVAHDFNNLLTAIRLFADLLREDLQNTEHVSNIDNIIHGCSSAGYLVKQLNSLSRREVVQPEHLDLNILIDELRSFVRSLLSEHIDINFSLAPEPAWVDIDRKQLEQVFFNLCLNARDAITVEGALSISVERITVSEPVSEILGPGDYIRLTIADNGNGIDEATQARIFEPFFTTKSKNKGTGLGLATCASIAREAQGDITVKSQLGQGAAFHIWLPEVVAQTEPWATPVPTDSWDETDVVILLIEDDDLVRSVSCMLIESLGHRVISFDNGSSALSYVEENGINDITLVVTDIVMPEMDGHEVAKRLLSLRPDLAVLYMSGYVNDPKTELAIAQVGNFFLPKPFSGEEFASKLAHILNGLKG